MGGGPSRTQKDARALSLENARKQSALGDTNAGRYNAIYGDVAPFYTNEMNNGLPFFNNLTDYSSGTVAQAYAPQEAALNRSLAKTGYLPSGFATAARSDLASRKAQTFNQMLQNALYANYQAKQQGAQGLTGLAQVYNPLPFYGGSTSAAGQGMQALQKDQGSNMLGTIGGIATGIASAIPW